MLTAPPWVVALGAMAVLVGGVQWGRTVWRWVSRGSRGIRHVRCKGCGRRIWRAQGDWLLACHRCGWKPGWPGLRWATRSVPVRAARQYPLRPALVILGGLLLTVAMAGVPVTYSAVAGPVGELGREIQSNRVGSGADEAGVVPSETATPATGREWPRGYNRTLVEQYFIQLLNEERQRRGLQPVTQRDALTEMARAHALNMAKYDYLGHTEPDGDTIRDRYQARGLLPECRLPMRGTDHYYPGAENVYQGYVEMAVQMPSGTHDIYSEKELAQSMFRTWMHSKGHREAMLVYSADQAGLSFAFVGDSNKLYAALELC